MKFVGIASAVCVGFVLSACEPRGAQLAAATPTSTADVGPSITAPLQYPPKEWPTSFWPATDWQWSGLEPEKAAPHNNKILWENDHVRLLEVTLWPDETENLNANPYPSVLIFDAAMPAQAFIGYAKEGRAEQARLEDSFAARGTAPPGRQYPTCATAAPQTPHQVTNRADFPLHFYRIEYKRIEGYGLQEHWKEWHPWLLKPLKPVKDLVPGPALGLPFTKDWPYPIAYDSIHAAPNNHFLRYEDAHIRFLEVALGVGRSENIHGHPYPSVFAVDNEVPPAALAASMEASKRTGRPPPADRQLDPNDPRNHLVGVAGFAPEKVLLQCITQDPQAPHGVQNIPPNVNVMGHFYRLEFKRVDGEMIKMNWQTWYPNTAQ
jgi:hypothetical protein